MKFSKKNRFSSQDSGFFLLSTVELKIIFICNSKNDILIIIEKVKKLRGFARTIYKNRSANDEYKPGEAKTRTIKGLHKWHVKKYQKLAWIALLHSEGSKREVKAYISNLADLHASVIKKLKEVKDDDKLYDLKIVLRNVEKLRNFADTLLS
jgi:tRNA-binding EMAP/Myf-like protein